MLHFPTSCLDEILPDLNFSLCIETSKTIELFPLDSMTKGAKLNSELGCENGMLA